MSRLEDDPAYFSKLPSLQRKVREQHARQRAVDGSVTLALFVSLLVILLLLILSWSGMDVSLHGLLSLL